MTFEQIESEKLQQTQKESLNTEAKLRLRKNEQESSKDSDAQKLLKVQKLEICMK